MSYESPIVAMLLGGLVPSLGLTYLARSGRGRSLLGRIRGRTLALVAVSVSVMCGGAVYFIIRSVLGSLRHSGPDAGTLAPPSTLAFLLFGLAVGIFLALPAAVLSWMDERARAGRRSKRRDHVATREERRTFATDLARQIRELSVPPREVEVSVGGDGDQVLLIRGPLDPQEGEKLTAALRSELRDLGFKRVEGSGGMKEWWTRV